MSKEEKLIYLAGPYTHEDEILRDIRAQLLTEASAKLMANGYNILSPITMGHNYAKYSKILAKKSSEEWQKWCKLLFDACDELWVLQLPGWQESVGVNKEIEWAKLANKSIEYLNLYFEYQNSSMDGGIDLSFEHLSKSFKG